MIFSIIFLTLFLAVYGGYEEGLTKNWTSALSENKIKRSIEYRNDMQMTSLRRILVRSSPVKRRKQKRFRKAKIGHWHLRKIG